MKTLDQLLSESLWARGLTQEQLERVRSETLVRQYPSGSHVCRKGERVEAWLGVIEGLVKVSSVNPSGKSVTFAGVRAGGWFGEGSLLKHEPRQYDVVALRDTRMACMPRSTFCWLLDTSLPFNRFLLMQLNERLSQFMAAVEHERLLDTDARVARSLASLFNPYLYPEVGPRLQISQEEIGYLSGTSRQRVNQALQVLQNAGLLKVEYGGITILDLEGLRRLGA